MPAYTLTAVTGRGRTRAESTNLPLALGIYCVRAFAPRHSSAFSSVKSCAASASASSFKDMSLRQAGKPQARCCSVGLDGESMCTSRYATHTLGILMAFDTSIFQVVLFCRIALYPRGRLHKWHLSRDNHKRGWSSIQQSGYCHRPRGMPCESEHQ